MRKAINEIVKIFIIMFVSALLISVTWQISSAKSVEKKYDYINLDSRYSDFKFDLNEKRIFHQMFVNSAMKVVVDKIGKFKNRKVAVMILEDDQYWINLRILFNELIIEFSRTDMTLRELYVKAFAEGLKEAESLKKRLRLRLSRLE